MNNQKIILEQLKRLVVKVLKLQNNNFETMAFKVFHMMVKSGCACSD